MRIWDVSPGYLNRQSLLGEHRELHGLHSILINGKIGYSRHPETRRWVRARSGLAQRHALLAAEMRLRGYVDRTPLLPVRQNPVWPRTFVDSPSEQLELLGRKYIGKPQGRIPLPRNAQELWAQHKYSVMARDPEAYRELGRGVSRLRGGMIELARDLVLILRQPPSRGRLANAVDHLWGYVRAGATPGERTEARSGPGRAFRLVQVLAVREQQPYLLASTVLSELAVYVDRA